MQAHFEREYWLRTSDFDRYGRLQPACILDLFQNAAGAHAELLGIGGTTMLEKQLMWVLTKVRYRVVRQVPMFRKVKVQTWPLPPSRIGFQREYCIRDEADNILIKGSSQWVLMHAEKRSFMPVQDVYPMELDFHTNQMFDGKIRRIRDFEPQGEARIVRPGFSDIDINGHVNNTKYANFALDALCPGEEESIAYLQIDYHRELQAGVAVHVEHRREDGVLLACGRSEVGENMFACRMELQ